MTDDRLVRTEVTGSELPDAMRYAMNAQSMRETMPASGNWHERALEGFLQSGSHALANPRETAVTVGSGLAIGMAIQTGLNNAELAGGKVGALAKAGRVAALAIPAVLSASEIAGAEDPANAAGRMAFEVGLFLGTAKAGTYADRIPGAGKLFGPRPTSPVPKELSYQVMGNNVRYSTARDFYGPVQVRLANGKGFTTDGRGPVPLVEMPKTVPGKGRLEYEPRSTSLVTDSGGRYARAVDGRSTSTTRDGTNYSLSENGSVTVTRTTTYGREELTIRPDGHKTLLQGDYRSGRLWNYSSDGSTSMRSLPAGKYRMEFKPDGEGVYKYTHGTSRGIMGMVGPRSRHAPLKIDERPMNIKEAGVPDVSVNPSITRDLHMARDVFRGLMR